MRTLTDAEITKEVSDILTRPWPLGDVLFVKNLYKIFLTGVIHKVDGVVVPTISQTPHIEDRDPCQKFNSLEAMVRAGWVVD